MGTRGPQPSQQTEAICNAIRAGLSYGTIAKLCKLSRQRIGEIAKTHSLSKTKPIDSSIAQTDFSGKDE